MPLDTFRQIFLPYCIQRDEDGSFKVLNREYHDLGFAGRPYALGSEPQSYALKGLGPKTLDKLALRPSTDGKQWFLYDDGCLPDSSPTAWRAYTERLWQLRRLEMKVPRHRR